MHSIQFVDGDRLPEGYDFLFIAVPDGGLIFYREDAVTPTSLEDSWAAYRAAEGGPRKTPKGWPEGARLALVVNG